MCAALRLDSEITQGWRAVGPFSSRIKGWFCPRRPMRRQAPDGPGLEAILLHLFHDLRPMVLHRALAEIEVGRDVLAGMAGENHFHDLSLSGA